MKVIRTHYFDKQVADLVKTYRLIESDVRDFLKNPLIHQVTDLGNGLIKCRYKNSSIPCGKSGGLRFLLIVSGEALIPLMVYSKRHIVNPSDDAIYKALQSIMSELP